MRCDKTRQFIQGFGKQSSLSWEEIVRARDLPINKQALDFISKLICIDANKRINVQDAIKHEFIKQFVSVIPQEKGCPFKVLILFNFFKMSNFN